MKRQSVNRADKKTEAERQLVDGECDCYARDAVSSILGHYAPFFYPDYVY